MHWHVDDLEATVAAAAVAGRHRSTSRSRRAGTPGSSPPRWSTRSATCWASCTNPHYLEVARVQPRRPDVDVLDFPDAGRLGVLAGGAARRAGRGVAADRASGTRGSPRSRSRRRSTWPCATAGSTVSARPSTTCRSSSGTRAAGPRSSWSKVNVAKVEALTAAGRMRPAGLAEVDGRQGGRALGGGVRVAAHRHGPARSRGRAGRQRRRERRLRAARPIRPVRRDPAAAQGAHPRGTREGPGPGGRAAGRPEVGRARARPERRDCRWRVRCSKNEGGPTGISQSRRPSS